MHRIRVGPSDAFGAGTLDLALVALDSKGIEKGQARVIAKDGQELGGHDIDAWLLEDLVEPFGIDKSLLHGDPSNSEGLFWKREMLAEARRVKEALFFDEWTSFMFRRPDVALGAAVLSADRFNQSDVIFHDYAFLTHDPKTHEEQTTVIIPAGTRVPTPDRVWTGRVVPTCALGDIEPLFKLVICEVARPRQGARFVRDHHGGLHQAGEGRAPVVVPLNKSEPFLGRLDPPHEPGDRKPRLELSFAVDGERWLRATVDDLKTGKRLVESRQVVRLV